MSTMQEQFEAMLVLYYPCAEMNTFENCEGIAEYYSVVENLAWKMWQAATEAAKATGTAGELPPLPKAVREKIDMPPKVRTESVVTSAHYTADQMREYGQQCAEAARQPAPVVAVKTWQERADLPDETLPFGLVEESMASEIADLRAALAATAAPVRNEADERDNEIFELQKALAFWLPQVNQFMPEEMCQRIAHDAYLLVIDGNLPDDFKTAQELGWILPATGKVQRDAEMVCGNCMEPIPITVMDTSSTRAPAAALSDESIDELAKPLMEQCVIVYGDMRRFARAILAATNRSQP